MCNILPFSHEVVTAVITAQAGLCLMCSRTVRSYTGGRNAVTSAASFISGLYIHTMNSQLKARTNGPEYDRTVRLLTLYACNIVHCCSTGHL